MCRIDPYAETSIQQRIVVNLLSINRNYAVAAMKRANGENLFLVERLARQEPPLPLDPGGNGFERTGVSEQ